MNHFREKCDRAWPAVLLTVSLLLATAGACAVEGAASQPPGSSPQPQTAAPEMDEVVVMGKKLYQMRQRLRQLEDRFDGRYNELNTIPDFRVQCDDEAPTGSRFVRHVCKPVYVAAAEREEAMALLRGYGAPPAEMVTAMRLDEYRRNMIQIVSKNPELLRLLKARKALEELYQKERKERFKGHWILFE